MSRVLLLTARDPLAASDAAHPARLARQLAAAGHDVALVLLEDAVAAARTGHAWSDAVVAAQAAGVVVGAEGEALARRGVSRLVDGVKAHDMGAIVELLMNWSERRAWL